MTARSTWMSRIALVLTWMAVTAGISFLVARTTAPEGDTTDLTADLPSITTAQRSTVSLADHTIAPIVSGDGRVVQDGAGWLLEAPAAPADVAYKLLDPPVAVKALIAGGPTGFDCAWAGLGQAADGSVTMRCRIPADVRVVAGLTGTMVLQMGQPTTTQALPVTAVVGAAGQGQVVVVNPDGTTSVRLVDLGISDVFWIEITSGLDPSESVLEYPTQRDLAQASA